MVMTSVHRYNTVASCSHANPPLLADRSSNLRTDSLVSYLLGRDTGLYLMNALITSDCRLFLKEEY